MHTGALGMWGQDAALGIDGLAGGRRGLGVGGGGVGRSGARGNLGVYIGGWDGGLGVVGGAAGHLGHADGQRAAHGGHHALGNLLAHGVLVPVAHHALGDLLAHGVTVLACLDAPFLPVLGAIADNCPGSWHDVTTGRPALLDGPGLVSCGASGDVVLLVDLGRLVGVHAGVAVSIGRGEGVQLIPGGFSVQCGQVGVWQVQQDRSLTVGLLFAITGCLGACLGLGCSWCTTALHLVSGVDLDGLHLGVLGGQLTLGAGQHPDFGALVGQATLAGGRDDLVLAATGVGLDLGAGVAGLVHAVVRGVVGLDGGGMLGLGAQLAQCCCSGPGSG
jgi:hypothetical protein